MRTVLFDEVFGFRNHKYIEFPNLHGIPPVCRVEGVEIEGVWGVVMRDGCEGQSVGPGRRKILNIDAAITASLLLAPGEQRRLDSRRR